MKPQPAGNEFAAFIGIDRAMPNTITRSNAAPRHYSARSPEPLERLPVPLRA
jgi:hypothetical protein